MRTRLTVRRTKWGWSLYCAGELVCSADHARDLLTCARHLGLVGRG